MSNTEALDLVRTNWERLYKEHGQKVFSMRLEDLVDLARPKPTVMFTPEARAKMQSLIKHSNIEISWHGLVNRIDDMTFLIYDIMVYPQICSATRVTTDDEEYSKWLNEIPDHAFSKVRYQGHSHVNMGCNPSDIDDGYYKEMLKNLRPGDFYIFTITNKRGDENIMMFQKTETETIFYPSRHISTDLAIAGQESILYAKSMMNKYVTTAVKPAKEKPGKELKV